MRFDEALRHLERLPDPLPAPPASIEARVVGRLDVLPPWVRSAEGTVPRDAAGLVLIYADESGDARVILTERPTGDLRHSGQISLPGGARDDADDFPIGTALREAAEEIGLDAVGAGVRVLGTLGTVDVRVSGFLLVPVLAVADRMPAVTPDPREVAAVLHAPVSAFLPGATVEVVEEERDGWRLRYGAFPVEGYRIWGATARVLGQLGEVLASRRS